MAASIDRRARSFFVSGGTLPLDSDSYIERRSDSDLDEYLRGASYCFVLNSRQMGKSSLSVRIIAKLQTSGIRAGFVDLTQIGGRNVTPEQWYAGIAGELGRVLGLKTEMISFFRENGDLSPLQRLFGAIRHVVLERIEAPIVIFIDEIDATRNLPFDADEFFAAIRECFNRRVREPIYQRLTFCLLGVAVPGDLIRNPTTTPFNIGERIHLQDFSVEELDKYALALGEGGETLLRRVHHWTNGQPFLTQSLCQAISDEMVDTVSGVDRLVERMFLAPKAKDTNPNLADVGNRALNDVADDVDPERFRADLLSAYDRVLKGGSLKDDESNRVAVVLKLAGLVRPSGSKLVPRNLIYREVFNRDWVKEHMPGQELLRQKQSYRRGWLRGISAAALVLATVTGLAIFAWTSRQAAVKAKAELDYQLYVADMNSMRLFEESGDVARMEEVLERNRISPHRGFEWGFWMARLHDSPQEFTLDYSAPGKREEGLLSRDGMQLCLIDDLLDSAMIIDLTSGAIRSRQPLHRRKVVSTSSGFCSIEAESDRILRTDLATGRELTPILQAQVDIGRDQVSWSSDHIIGRDRSGSKLRIAVWNIWSGKQTYRLEELAGPTLTPLAVCSDGKRILFQEGSGSYTTAVAWDVQKNLQIDRFDNRESQVEQISVRGSFLAYRFKDSPIRIRDLLHRKELPRLEFSDEAPVSGTFLPNEKTFVRVFPDGRVVASDISTGKTLSIHRNAWYVHSGWTIQGPILGSAISVRLMRSEENAGMRTLGTGRRVTKDGLGNINLFNEDAKTVDVLSDPQLVPQGRFALPMKSRALTYNGLWNMAGKRMSDNVTIASIRKGPEKIQVPPETANFACGANFENIALVRNDRALITGISGKTGEERWRYKPPIRVQGIWMTPDSQTVLAPLETGGLVVLDAKSGQIKRSIKAHEVRLTNILFTDGGKKFFTGGLDGRIVLWDLASLKPIIEFHGNAAQFFSGADLSPDGTRVATCNLTGSWQIWNAKTGERLLEMNVSKQPLRAVLFTADGKSVLTAGEDMVVRQWKTLGSDPTVRIPLDLKNSRV